MSLSGGKKLSEFLGAVVMKMRDAEVQVGFLEGATYPNGTPVAAVAYWNEYGDAGRLARPFFRQMIAAESPTWGPKMARLAKATNYDGERVMGLMGADIKGGLQQSINTLTTPALAASTIAAKGNAKPLVDTAHMLQSVDYEVT